MIREKEKYLSKHSSLDPGTVVKDLRIQHRLCNKVFYYKKKE